MPPTRLPRVRGPRATVTPVPDSREQTYPGEQAGASRVLDLAREYREAAGLLRGACRRGEPLSQAPFRLAAAHAIELYLNAVLLHQGVAPAAVRGLQHDVARRARLAEASGLSLRRRTAEDLARMASDREYLAARCCSDRAVLPPPDRLAASLEEIARKASLIVGGDAAVDARVKGGAVDEQSGRERKA